MIGVRAGCSGGLWSENLLAEVLPLGIPLLDEPQLPRAVPLLQLLLARDCLPHVLVELEAHEDVDTVPLREPLGCVSPVLPDARTQVAGHGGLESAVAAAG